MVKHYVRMIWLNTKIRRTAELSTPSKEKQANLSGDAETRLRSIEVGMQQILHKLSSQKHDLSTSSVTCDNDLMQPSPSQTDADATRQMHNLSTTVMVNASSHSRST